MGLLDFQNKLPGLLQDDGFRLGLSLLAAAGPSATPMSAGQRIQQGLMAFQQQKDSEEDRKLKREWQQAQIGGQQAKAAQQAQVQALLGRFTQPGGAGVAGMSPGDMLALKAAGVDPTEIVKYAGQGNKFDPGAVYQNPTTPLRDGFGPVSRFFLWAAKTVPAAQDFAAPAGSRQVAARRSTSTRAGGRLASTRSCAKSTRPTSCHGDAPRSA